jgi:hypothetical protein
MRDIATPACRDFKKARWLQLKYLDLINALFVEVHPSWSRRP